MEDMAQDFGWSMDDDIWGPPPTEDELALEERSQFQMTADEAFGELYAAQFD